MNGTSREGGWAPPGWDEYTAARFRFFARLAADRVLRDVARTVEDDVAGRPAAGQAARQPRHDRPATR